MNEAVACDGDSDAFYSDLETPDGSSGESAASAGGLGESVSDSTSENFAETDAQAGHPLGVGLGQTLQERDAKGVIHARPAARRAAAQAQQTGRDDKKEDV